MKKKPRKLARRLCTALTAVALVAPTATAQVLAPALDNDYVRVARDATPCASATVRCGERIIVALSALEVRIGNSRRKLTRGDIAVFKTGESYEIPAGSFYEVSIKLGHPLGESPGASIPPAKNTLLYDGDGYVVFEERLAVGDTRARHSHSHRVVIQLNRTRLRQKPDGEAEIDRDIEPDRVAFNTPVIHTAKNIGSLPLRGIVIEFKTLR